MSDTWRVKGAAGMGVLAALALLLLAWPLAARQRSNDSGGGRQQGVARPAPVGGFSGVSPLVIPAAAFTDDGNSSPGDFFYSFAGGFLEAAAINCQMAPLRLPAGVSVRRLGATFYDNAINGDASLTLWRVDTVSSVPATLGTVATSLAGADPEIQYLVDETIDNPRINNEGYTYYAALCLDPGVRLYSVIVDFDQVLFLPATTFTP